MTANSQAGLKLSPSLSLQINKLTKELKMKQTIAGHESNEVQRDIELRELQDLGSSVIQQLGNLAAKEPELMSVMQLLFSQANLSPPPSPAPSRTSSVASSARSSTSQLSSISGRYFQPLYNMYVHQVKRNNGSKDLAHLDSRK